MARTTHTKNNPKKKSLTVNQQFYIFMGAFAACMLVFAAIRILILRR